MGNFCKGAFLGIIAGVAIGAVVIAKNKNLACKLNKGLTIAEDKIKEVKDDIEEKIIKNNGNQNGEELDNNCDCSDPMCSCNEQKNNFSKKNKND